MRKRGGFTLMEVMIAIAIASTGIVMLFEGLRGVLVAERRGRFYDRITAYVQQRADSAILACSRGITPPPGLIDALEPAITVAYAASLVDLPDHGGTGAKLTRVEITFSTSEPRAPLRESLVTYHTGALSLRSPTGKK